MEIVLQKLDHTGIAVMSVGTFVPTFLLMVIFFLCYMVGFYFIMPGMPLVLSIILPMPIMGKGMGLNMMSVS